MNSKAEPLKNLVAAGWRASTTLRLAAEIAEAKGMHGASAHFNNEADALVQSLRFAEQELPKP